MTTRPRALLAWSSGKDSAWSLHELRAAGEVEVVGLLTTINQAFDRVAMHAVRIELLRAQADAAGLPLWPVLIPWPCSNAEYEAAMAAALARARDEGIGAVAFGDLFLEDIRRYREERLAPTGIRPLFPLWGRPTAALADQMLAGGAARPPDLRRPARPGCPLRRPRVRRRAAGRDPRLRRPMRRARRVSHLRVRWSDVLPPHPHPRR